MRRGLGHASKVINFREIFASTRLRGRATTALGSQSRKTSGFRSPTPELLRIQLRPIVIRAPWVACHRLSGADTDHSTTDRFGVSFAQTQKAEQAIAESVPAAVSIGVFVLWRFFVSGIDTDHAKNAGADH